MITEGLDLLIDIGNDLYETMLEEFELSIKDAESL